MTWHDLAHTFLSPDAQFADQIDADQGSYCAAAFVDGELDSYLSIGVAGKAAPLAPILNALARKAFEEQGTGTLATCDLSAISHEPVVCACFDVTVAAVRKAVASGEAKNVTELGTCLRAGTNCGSCLPELKRIIARERNSQTV
jgi:assimilatory nitrate reductase catalytic subunit